MLRKILGALAGIVAAVLIFSGVEAIGAKIYPLPEGLDPADHQAMSDYTRTLPTAVLLIVMAGWGLGSFVCGLLIRLISRSNDKSPAYIAGLFLMTAGIVNLLVLPHPTWFRILGIFMFIPFTLLGHSLVKNSRK